MPTKITAFSDDIQAVPDTAILYRRIDWDMLGGRSRCEPGCVAKLSANCFNDCRADIALEKGYPGLCMSVGISILLEEYGFPPEKMIENFPGMGLARVMAAHLRTLRQADKDKTPCPQGLMLDPTDDEPWHGIIFDPTGKRSNGTKKAILRGAEWVIPLINDVK